MESSSFKKSQLCLRERQNASIIELEKVMSTCAMTRWIADVWSSSSTAALMFSIPLSTTSRGAAYRGSGGRCLAAWLMDAEGGSFGVDSFARSSPSHLADDACPGGGRGEDGPHPLRMEGKSAQRHVPQGVIEDHVFDAMSSRVQI